MSKYKPELYAHKRIYKLNGLPDLEMIPIEGKYGVNNFLWYMYKRFKYEILKDSSFGEFKWDVSSPYSMADSVKVTISEENITENTLKEIEKFNKFMIKEYYKIRDLYKLFGYMGIIEEKEVKK